MKDADLTGKYDLRKKVFLGSIINPDAGAALLALDQSGILSPKDISDFGFDPQDELQVTQFVELLNSGLADLGLPQITEHQKVW